jgi:membrane-bound serine protease (ClpP class)
MAWRVPLLAGLLLAATSELAAAQGSPLVFTAEVDGFIHPVSADYMIETMDRADRAGATLVVFTLSTPGGLLDSTRAIVSRMLRATTPVAVFIAPAGARAASAGFILTIAADVAVMSPGTHLGAAHPVGGSGRPDLLVVGIAAAIGFTVSLFFATAAFLGARPSPRPRWARS